MTRVKISEKAIPYIHYRRILFGDTDSARIVYTPRFSDYCMEAAEVWFREYLDSDWYEMNTYQEMGTPVVHMEFDFSAPLLGNDQLMIDVRVEKVGTSTVTLAFEGKKKAASEQDDVKSFTAKIVFCYFSNQTESAIAIPTEQRQLITDYCDACEQLTTNQESLD